MTFHFNSLLEVLNNADPRRNLINIFVYNKVCNICPQPSDRAVYLAERQAFRG